MEKDLELYNEYLNGNKESFDLLYNKYKDKIQYFIFNIVKDYQKSEDITQEVFIYVMKNPVRDNCSFKYYIYLIAKSRAYNYINNENKRSLITEKYLSNENEQTEKDIIDIITKKEKEKEVIEAINELDDKYKNAIYLVSIEELSYKQTAEILGENIQNIKNLVHRSKKELRKILIKNGVYEANRTVKIFIIFVCITIVLSGVTYAIYKIINNDNKGKVNMTPLFSSKISTIDENKVWVGTFNLVWNDLMDDIIGGKIEFEDGYSELAEELNKQNFTSEQLSTDSYFKIQGEESLTLKNKIEEEIDKKFNQTSDILDKCDWNDKNGYILYAILNKEFNFLEKFQTLDDNFFGDSKEKVKYFGIEPITSQNAKKNVEVLFYNSENDFAIKLKTQEGEGVYLYRTTGKEKSFEENYKEMLEKQNLYTGESNYKDIDILKIPFIKVNDEINYDELCGKIIKGTKGTYIKQALQTIDFELNNVGGSVKSEALIELRRGIATEEGRKFIFDNDFIVYMKEENKEKPYFALKVDNIDVLQLSEN